MDIERFTAKPHDVERLNEPCSPPTPYDCQPIKPTIGAKPFYVAAWDRMAVLGHAIGRYCEQCDESIDTDRVRTWAREILLQCDLVDKLSDE